MKEVEVIAEGIFSDLVDGVLDEKNNLILIPDFCEFKTPKRSFSSLSPRKLSEYEIEEENASTVSIYQFKTEKQRTRFTCGYNTMFNGWLIYKLCTMEDLSNENISLNSLYNKFEFWYFSEKVKKALLEEQKNHDLNCYPWSTENIMNHIIEREYMRFLLADSPVFFSIPDTSRKLRENAFLTVQRIERIHKIFEDFKKGEEKIHVFGMGALNHWFALVINRYGNNKLEAIVADSRNWTFFGLNDNELTEYIKERVDEFYKYYPKNYPLSKKDMVPIYVTSMKESFESVMLVIDCCSGKKDFIEECLDASIHGILKQYILAQGDIYMFMDSFFPPTTFKLGILTLLKSFKEYVSKLKSLQLIKNWLVVASEGLKAEKKIPKFDFSAANYININNEAVWQFSIEKEMERVKNNKNIEKIPLEKQDLKNKEKMILIIKEFQEFLNKCK